MEPLMDSKGVIRLYALGDLSLCIFHIWSFIFGPFLSQQLYR